MSCNESKGASPLCSHHAPNCGRRCCIVSGAFSAHLGDDCSYVNREPRHIQKIPRVRGVSVSPIGPLSTSDSGESSAEPGRAACARRWQLRPGVAVALMSALLESAHQLEREPLLPCLSFGSVASQERLRPSKCLNTAQRRSCLWLWASVTGGSSVQRSGEVHVLGEAWSHKADLMHIGLS